MSDLFGIGLSGLGAARSALTATSDNISNIKTPGYHRQRATLEQLPGSHGTGNGVKVSSIERMYQQYLEGQLQSAESKSSALDSHLSQVTQIDNMLADSDSGLAPLMQKFFSGFQDVAANPNDTASRQSLLGDAQAMAGQFRAFSKYLSDMQGSVEQQMNGAVSDINNYASQIAKLNKQITVAQSQTSQPPNRLLDQRDQLVSELGKLANVDLSVQDGSTYLVTVGGRPLVDATGSHELAMMQSDEDPTRRILGYVTANGDVKELDTRRMTGGSLGGLVSFREESLQPTRQRLNQLAYTLKAEVNKVHRGGEDLEQNSGVNFFDPATSDAEVYFNDNNTGNATASVSLDSDYISDVRDSNYRVTYDGSNYNVTRLSDGKQLTPGDDLTINGNEVSFGGVHVTVSGAPQAGDSFLVKPVANAADNFHVALTDAAQVAASKGGGVGDNENALALADLQNKDVVEGNASFNDTYAQLVSVVGNKTHTLQVNSDAQEAMTQDLKAAQQSVSGVNLDEERVNLMYYQQMYQANSRVIQTASTLFDTLLRIA